MTLILQRPTGSKLTLRQTWQPMDPDAAAYITAVETVDGQALEEKVKIAIDNFVLGCKADGIWSAIKASCILAGARTLAGALVPLVGTAPTNYNFVSGDYDRETGLIGDGSTKYLDSNRNNNADPQDSKHLCFYKQAGLSSSESFIGISTVTSGGSWYIYGGGQTYTRINAAASYSPAHSYASNSFYGLNRSSSSAVTVRGEGISTLVSSSSASPANENIKVFGGPADRCRQRLAFYSIGESLDLAALDTRVSALITAIGAAIP